MSETGVTVREITAEIATLAVQFPAELPADPADRIIAAAACAAFVPLVTADERLRATALVKTIW